MTSAPAKPTDSDALFDKLSELIDEHPIGRPMTRTGATAAGLWRALRRHEINLTKAAQDVLAERDRQRQKWGDKHDDEHRNDSLAYGAVDFLLPGPQPQRDSWAYKSKVTDREPRREQLVKGAALALAAIEQWDRTHGVIETSDEAQQARNHTERKRQ